MKQMFFLFMAIVVVACRNNTNTGMAEREGIDSLFRPMIEDEAQYIMKNLEGLRRDKGQAWYTGDSIFYTAWLNGTREELNNNYEEAEKQYQKALNTKRYEISSYEVKLSLGRLYLELNDKQKARQMLQEYKQEAQKDLSGEEVEWGLTDEARKAIAQSIEDCDILLQLTEE